MANKTQMEYTINVRAKTDQAINDIKALGNSLNTAFAGGTGNKELANSLGKLDKLVNNLTDKLNKPVTSESTFNKIKDDTNDAVLELNKLLTTLEQVSKSSNEEKLEFVDQAALNNLTKLRDILTQYTSQLHEVEENTKKITQLEAQKAASESKLKQAVTNQKAANQQQQRALQIKKDYIANVEKQRKLEERIANGERGKIELEAATLKASNQATADQYQYGSIDTAYKAGLSRASEWANRDAAKAETAVNKLTTEFNNADREFKQAKIDLDALNTSTSTETWNQLSQAFNNVGISISNIKPTDAQSLTNLVDQKDIQVLDEANQKIREQAQLIRNLIPAVSEAKQENEENAQTYRETNAAFAEVEGIKNRIKQIVSLTGAMHLLTRATRSAFQTIKELDKTMTETAVVTDFSVGDMWDQLDSYAEKANQLGMAINDVYEASTLYYQQGLSTQQVTALTTQTLKMARIAGLDAAEATDRMTAALRGFNMTINETNATNVSDVYSKLAAITASNVDEISTAMTKVASLANSANMSFENTAAFLSQIIETTRESAETAGTALKTVVARFAEVKTNINTTTDSEGEELNYNKIDAALKSVGISMDAFMKGQEGLDQVLMRLAEKWDTLDTVTQRYIATQAAGSRQQSRFIALMSDYQRTLELTTAAQNAAGASATQYDKTLESMQTKLNNLKNAWDTLTMSLMNSELLKTGIDILTSLVNGINQLNESFSGTAKSVVVIGELVLALGLLDIGLKAIERKALMVASAFVTDAAAAEALQKSIAKLNGTGIITQSMLGKLGKGLASLKNALVSAWNALKAFAMGAAGAAAILAVVAVAIIAVVKAIKTYNNLSPEGRIKTLTSELNTLNDELDDTSAKLDEINTAFENINEATTTLKTLTEGTAAWNTQLGNVNGQLMDFMASYPEFSEMVERTASGMYYISDENQAKIQQILQDKQNQLKGKIAIASVQKNNATLAQAQQDLTNSIGTGQSNYDPVYKVISNILNDKNANLNELSDRRGIEKYLTGTGIEDNLYKEQLVNGIYDKMPEIIKLLEQQNQLQAANTVILDTYAQSFVTENNKDVAGYVGRVISNAVEQDTTDYFTNSKYNKNLMAQEVDFLKELDSGYKFKSRNNGQITYTDASGQEFTKSLTDLQDTYNRQQAYKTAAANQNDYANKARDYTDQLVESFNGQITKEMATSLTTQIADIQSGKIKNFDFSGINYKAVLAANVNDIQDQATQAAFINTRFQYQKANAQTSAVAEKLGINSNSEKYDDLFTRIKNNQNLLDTGSIKQIAEVYAKEFTLAEINALQLTTEQRSAIIEKRTKDIAEANQKAQQKGNNNIISENANTTFLEAGVSSTNQQNIIDTVATLNPQLKTQIDLLNAVTASIVKTQTGISALNEAYQENKEIIDAANKTSANYWSSLSTVAVKFNDILGTSIDSKFLDENLGLLQDALNGDTDAFIALTKAAADANLANLDVPDAAKLEEAAKATVSGYTAAAGTLLKGGIFEVLDQLVKDNSMTDETARLIGRQYGAEKTDKGWQALGSNTIAQGMSGALLGSSVDYLKGQYNTLFKISQLQAKLNKSQITYNRLLNNSNKSSRTRIKLLKEQMDYNAAMADEYGELVKKQEEAVKKFLNTGNNSSYFSYDFESGLASIADDASTQAREQFEELVSTLNEYIASEAEYYEANSATKKQAKDTYYSLIDKAASMLQEQDQKALDLLQQQLDAEKEAASKIIDSIESSFSQLRQDRENEKKENDINTLTRRIAYLRQDTSGSNALQLKQLEKELAQQTQDYGDTLIDQSIKDLADSQDEAYEQRAQQLENQQAQIDWMTEYGTYNQKATEIIKDTLDALEEGTLIQNTAFGELVTNTGLALTSDQLDHELQSYLEDLEQASLFDYTANAEKFKEKFPAIAEKPIPVKTTDSGGSDTDTSGYEDSALKKLVKQYAEEWEYDYIKDLYTNGTSTKSWNQLAVAFKKDAQGLDGNYTTAQISTAQNALYDWVREGDKTAYEKLDETLNIHGKAITASTQETAKNTAEIAKSVSGANDNTAEYYAANKLTGTASNGVYYVGGVPYTESTGTKNSNGTTSYKSTDTITTNSSKLKTGDTYTDKKGNTMTYVAGTGWIRGTPIKYASGGLNTHTGPAWLDGTFSKPELVLNAQDTQNFLELKDVLRDWNNTGSIASTGNYAFDVNINVDELADDYDVDKLATRVEKNITDAMKYRNNTRTNRTR